MYGKGSGALSAQERAQGDKNVLVLGDEKPSRDKEPPWSVHRATRTMSIEGFEGGIQGRGGRGSRGGYRGGEGEVR